ncbi:MAG: glycosyltransferase, partial [Chitinophagaceae bacterium]|nr:glycosyltransferase [Chitinophagaceae bacterium]
MHCVFIIIPAYNENEMLRATVEQFSLLDYTIVVVDDGSEIDQAFYLTGLQVTIIRHKINLGQGASLQTGNEYALKNGADFIVHFDADGQHSVVNIQALLAP